MNGPTTRILITGTREALESAEKSRIDSAMTLAIEAAYKLRCDVEILVGDCPTGVDDYALRCGRSLMMQGAIDWVEVFKADWQTHGKAAGPLRNQAMVDKKPWLALAFPLVNGSGVVSRGTTDCMNRCLLAGIPVWVYPIRNK